VVTLSGGHIGEHPLHAVAVLRVNKAEQRGERGHERARLIAEHREVPRAVEDSPGTDIPVDQPVVCRRECEVQPLFTLPKRPLRTPPPGYVEERHHRAGRPRNQADGDLDGMKVARTVDEHKRVVLRCGPGFSPPEGVIAHDPLSLVAVGDKIG
jgi:hypothetical protein